MGLVYVNDQTKKKKHFEWMKTNKCFWKITDVTISDGGFAAFKPHVTARGHF